MNPIQVQSFSSWDGKTPFFADASDKDRFVYMQIIDEDGVFLAFGYTRTSDQRGLRFIVQGNNKDEKARFTAEMRQENARVIWGAPPLDTYGQGDKPPVGNGGMPPGVIQPEPTLSAP